MNRTTAAVVATLIALVFLAGTSGIGFTAASNISAIPSAGPQQTGALEIDIWLSEVGSTQPVRRLSPETAEAQVIVQSNLGDRDPKNFRVELRDANGIQVFQSRELVLPTGAYSETVPISGKDLFQAYVDHADAQKGELGPAIDEAINTLEQERLKEPCAEDPSQRTQPSRVADRINQALGVRETINNIVQQLLRFSSLGSEAHMDLSDAAAEFETVFSKGSAARDKLTVPDDAPRCSGEGAPDAPDWEPDWNAVRADLEDMDAANDVAVSKIESALAAMDWDADRTFPPSGVEGRCVQNSVELRSADTGDISESYWWTVGEPGVPARLTNPQESTSPPDPTDQGNLLARPSRIYSTQVDVDGVPHSTVVEALVLDELCLPVPGVTVSFEVDEPIVEPEETAATTDANGVATVSVNATDEVGDGMATVEATVNSAQASTGLDVIGPPSRLDLRLGTSERERVPNYAVESTVQANVVVKDANNNDVADGTSVQFSIDPPDEHHVDLGGQVTTSDGQASANLIFGSSKGFYTVKVEAGDAQDTQAIQVVGPPAAIEVDADPRILSVDTPFVDQRTSTLTAKVYDGEDKVRPAPDGTSVEFEFVESEDADWASFSQGQSRVSLRDGEASTALIGAQTWYREIEIKVTATYSFGGEVRGSVSTDPENPLTIILRGETTFLPLIASR